MQASTTSAKDEKRPSSVVGSFNAAEVSATETTADRDNSTLEAGEPNKPGPPLGFQVPDGGLQAWLVVVGGWLVLFCTFGSVNAFGVYQTYYVRTLGKTDSEVAWIGSFQLWLQLVSGFIVGPVFDRGYGRTLNICGTLVYIFSLFMLSLCKEYWQVFLAQGVGIGIALGLLFLPSLSVIPQWFSKKRAFATGIVVSGSSCGGIAFPIMINRLLESHGYAYTVRATGYVITGCLVVACVLIKFRIPGRKHRPAHMQLPAPDMKSVVRHRPYQFLIAGGFCIAWGLFLPIFFMQTFAELHGMNKNLAFYLLAILNAASIFGRLIPNFLADKFGSFNLVISASTCTAILIFVWPTATNTGGMLAFTLLYGFVSGAYVSLVPACVASLSSHIGEIGARIGFAWAVISFAALTGPPILGALLGSGPVFHWWRPVGFAGTAVSVGTMLLFFARVLHAREKGMSKV